MFNKLCEKLNTNNYYDFLNEKDLKSIFKRSKVFQFDIDYLGFIEPKLFMNYIYYGGLIDSYSDNISKLLNLCMNQVTQEHQILGNLNIILQNYISEKEMSSSNLVYIDNSGYKISNLNPGEFIERLLYDRSMIQPYYNEMLFILDEENYNTDFEEFKNNYMKCRNSPYKISKSLSNFFETLNINVNINLNSKELGPLTINESLANSNKEFEFYLGRRNHSSYLHPKE